LFAFYLQPINPNLSCVVIHVVAATNGKGNADVLEKLLELSSILESCYALDVISRAFDRDSCFDGLRSWMSADLSGQLDICDPGLLNFYPEHLVISDSLDFMKRIRYRWVCSNFSISFGSEDITFSLESI
jgi:hypothetical protein